MSTAHVGVGDIVRWRGQIYTIKAVDPAITFEEPDAPEGVPVEGDVELVQTAAARKEFLDRTFARLEVDQSYLKSIAELFDAEGKPRGMRLPEIEEALADDNSVLNPDKPYVCRWCGGNCPRFGNDTCPLRPRQIPRTPRPKKDP